MKKRSNPWWRTLIYVALILAGILVYAYGWRVTDIDLEVPQESRRQTQVTRALRGLLSPDLFDRDEESQTADARFSVPCRDKPPAQAESAEGQSYITVSPTCGEPKDSVTIEGFNFRPYTDGIVRWSSPEGRDRSLGKIRTDGEGHFKNQFPVPTVSESTEPYVVEVEVAWPVGVPRPSEALTTTVDRMIETIFLALMATTFAVVIAIPISFIAAFNLMRQIETPFGSFLASLIPLPFGWILGRRLLRPGSQIALDLGDRGWPGLLVLASIAVALYFLLIRREEGEGRIRNPFLSGLARYVRMILSAILFLFVSGIIAGLGAQLSLVLEGFLGGILSNIVGSLAELLNLLLPVLAGVSGILILSSLVSTLMNPLLDRIESEVLHRVIGFVLSALAGGMLFFLVYRGVFSFYNPGEPAYLTLQIASVGAVAGGALGLILGANYQFPAGLIIYYVTRTTLNALRSIEPLIMAIVFAIWVSIGPFAGVLALTLHSIAALGKLYSEQVESIDPGPIEAITATGATRLQVIIYGVVPQIVPPYLAFTLYRWDINVRMSTVIGFVGGGGIGFILQQWINLLQYQKAGVAVLAIAIVVATLDYVSAQARERIT